jgi:hypothetical protein
MNILGAKVEVLETWNAIACTVHVLVGIPINVSRIQGRTAWLSSDKCTMLGYVDNITQFKIGNNN